MSPDQTGGTIKCPNCESEIVLAAVTHTRPPAHERIWHAFRPDCKKVCSASGEWRVSAQFTCQCGCAWRITSTSHSDM